MSDYRHIRTSQSAIHEGAPLVTVVTFMDSRIDRANQVAELGNEWIALVERERPVNLLISFSGVVHVSKKAAEHLLVLERAVKQSKGVLRLCNVSLDVRDVIDLVDVAQLLDIRDCSKDGLTAWPVQLPA